LLSTAETLRRASELDLAHPCVIGADWPAAITDTLAGVVETADVKGVGSSGATISALQLTELKGREERLCSVLSKRAMKAITPIADKWDELLKQAIQDAGGTFEPRNPRHTDALREQAEALKCLTARGSSGNGEDVGHGRLDAVQGA
jgi:hypothetical protein